MAVTIDTNFNGDYSPAIYSDLAEGNEVIENGIAYLELDVPDKRELRYSTQTEYPIGDYVKTPTGANSTFDTTVGKRELEMRKNMIYTRFSPEDYDLEWEDLRSMGSQTEHKISPKLFAEIMKLLLPNAGSQIAKNFFQGQIGGSAGLNRFDGILTKAQADANTVQVVPAGVITQSNVIDILTSVIDAIPDKDYNDPTYTILVSTNTWRKLQRANTAVKEQNDGVLEDTFKNMLENKRIMPFVGMKEDTIIATKIGNTIASNLVFGFWFDEANEMRDIRIGRVSADSDEWFLRVNLKMDANYKFSENLIYYVPA